jgi:hypothetical protein
MHAGIFMNVYMICATARQRVVCYLSSLTKIHVQIKYCHHPYRIFLASTHETDFISHRKHSGENGVNQKQILTDTEAGKLFFFGLFILHLLNAISDFHTLLLSLSIS